MSIDQHFERNPFATRYVRPGAVGFRFADDQSVSTLVDRLRDSQWMGEIVGPHGSGKSTLLQTLIPLIQESGREVKLFTLHQGESRLPISDEEMSRWSDSTQIIVDGYEQLSRASCKNLLKCCRENACGLLVTSHEPTGLPLIYSSTVSVELVQSLVRDLQSGGPVRVFDNDVAMSMQRHHGNVRDVFFELYDIFQQRR